MSDEVRLTKILDRIDGRSYPAYRELKGQWDLGGFLFFVDRVQGDPFAAPSRVRVRVACPSAGDYFADCDARLAAEDWILRQFVKALVSKKMGSGRSGDMRCLRPGPEVEERSAIRLFEDGTVEARFQIGLPARGRRVLGQAAWDLIDGSVRDAAAALQNSAGLDEHVRSIVFQRALRRAASERNLVAFIANGSVLPRASGVDSGPLPDAVCFESPASLEVQLDVGSESVLGMGIPEGVTAVVGGGFHGKSTLLQAIQRGHLDHVPGDGRERVVADLDTVKVRAEDGRRVASVDISAFLNDLPGGRGTRPFSTEDASGSTSQAAGIIEAMESGAKVLLVDEDTSATNLLVRDPLMRKLISADREPITPFVEQVRGLFHDHGISTVIVVGGVGAYLGVSDTIVGMNAYRPEDMRDRVDELMGPSKVCGGGMPTPWIRKVETGSFEPGKIRARDGRRISYGRNDIDLVGIEQVLSGDHAWSVGQALATLYGRSSGSVEMSELLDALDQLLDSEGVDALSPRSAPDGGLIRPRRHEVAAALNRLRSLRVEGMPKDVRKHT